MNRRVFVCTITAGLVVARSARDASLPRVAIVFNNPKLWEISTYPFFQAFVRGLRERGLEEGRDIALIPRSAEGGPHDRMAQIMRELVESRIDVIVTTGPG